MKAKRGKGKISDRIKSRNRVLARLVECLKPYDPERLILYGSWVYGEEDELSDIDLVIIKETDRPFLERLVDASRCLIGFDRAVDLLVYTPKEFENMKEEGNAFAELVLEEGRLIYGKKAA